VQDHEEKWFGPLKLTALCPSQVTLSRVKISDAGLNGRDLCVELSFHTIILGRPFRLGCRCTHRRPVWPRLDLSDLHNQQRWRARSSRAA